MKHRPWMILIACLLVFAVSMPAGAQLKKRVAVFTFEDKTDKQWSWWDGRHPGDGMADMLTTELVKSGKYLVVERQEIAGIIAEQKLGQEGFVTPESAAEAGKLLGVELAVIGAVTEFGHSRGETGGRIQGVGVGVSSQKATVAVDIRFVNTTTGEILAAETVRRDESKSGIRFSSDKLAFNNRNDFDNSIIGKATREAINDIVVLIDNQMAQMPWEGKIILVQGTSVYIKPGADAGVQVGDSFTIYSQGQALIDPDTGLSLGNVESKIGTIQVTSLVSGGKAAQAVVKSGSGMSKGDLVRLQ